ncbi:hypothetical protein CAPTEDRAFT_184853 [Capitella teleta]|uniref:G-protein coupled receptors family 1 profile domain-containing protein n=1 Tax=Capitella teleta TaxID=283909 RepID=X1ZH61_CAPTE|nr:hypothetical protein CAPTEDRAFT_184853 [Capitella teleta]|eukprot:ELT90067.1 hypothetical protein CAPTEDRAFT_184853 [Capitella teleta]
MTTTEVSPTELMTPQDLITIGYRTLKTSPEQGCQLPVLFNIVVNVVLVGGIGILGLIGNTLSVVVFITERSSRVAILLLQALAIADNICLLTALVYIPFILGILPSLSTYSSTVNTVTIYFQAYIEPLGFMAQMGTTWIVVLLAANRYFAICRPFQAQRHLTMFRTKIQITFVVIFSVVFNIPRFFQTRITTDPLNGHTKFERTSLETESNFGKIYTNALYTVLVLVLPFSLLLILNVRLICSLRASRSRLRMHSVNRIGASENNITLVMIVIIVVFLFCLLPDRLIPVFTTMLGTNSGCFLKVLLCISNLLFVINSSVNVFIYCLLRRRFRKLLVRRIFDCQTELNRPTSSANFNSLLVARECTQNVHFSGSSRRTTATTKT